MTLLPAAAGCGKNATYAGSEIQSKFCSDSPWLDTGDTAWQLTAATFVGLMSIPALAVLYAGLVPRKWAVDTMMMTFTAFSAVLIVWVLWGYKMGFGSPMGGGTANPWNYRYNGNLLDNLFSNFIGHPETSPRGIFADPSVIEYRSVNGSPISFRGWLYGNRHQFFIQLFAALTIIVYDAIMTFVILKVISLFTPLRMPEDDLEIGDVAVHDEEAYPGEGGFSRVIPVSSTGVASGAPTPLAGDQR